MNYREKIIQAAGLIESSDFWKEISQDEASKGTKGRLNLNELEHRSKLEHELIQQLDEVDPNLGKITLAFFYVVRDDNPSEINDMIINKKIKEISPSFKNDELCWQQLFGKFTFLRTINIGLALFK